MPEQEVILQEKAKPENTQSIWFFLILLNTAQLLEKIAAVPFGVGLAIGMVLASANEYRIKPQPIGLLNWMKRSVIGTLVFLIGLWLGPKLLSRWIPISLGYAISLFITMSCTPWIYYIMEKEIPWACKTRKNTLEWMAISLFMGLSLGAMKYFKPSLL